MKIQSVWYSMLTVLLSFVPNVKKSVILLHENIHRVALDATAVVTGTGINRWHEPEVEPVMERASMEPFHPFIGFLNRWKMSKIRSLERWGKERQGLRMIVMRSTETENAWRFQNKVGWFAREVVPKDAVFEAGWYWDTS